MVARLFAPQFVIVYLFAASAAYVHFRGKMKLRLWRQLADHSTWLAPYNVLMYLFQAVPNKPVLSLDHFSELKPLRDNWQVIREEALNLFDEGRIRAAANNNDWGFYSFFKSGWKRFELRGLLHHRRWRELRVARRQSHHVRRDLYPHRREPHRPESHHPVLRRRAPDEVRLHDGDQPLGAAHLVKASASQNEEGEKVGVINKVFSQVYKLHTLGQRFKARNYNAYYAMKYAVVALIVASAFA